MALDFPGHLTLRAHTATPGDAACLAARFTNPKRGQRLAPVLTDRGRIAATAPDVAAVSLGSVQVDGIARHDAREAPARQAANGHVRKAGTKGRGKV